MSIRLRVSGRVLLEVLPRLSRSPSASRSALPPPRLPRRKRSRSGT